MILPFLSRDMTHWFGNVHQRMAGGELSHGGLHRQTVDCDETFEQRYRAGHYPWVDYEEAWKRGTMRLKEWRFRRMPDARMDAIYYTISKSWTGHVYNASQVVGMLSRYLWMRVGVLRDVRQTSRGVCTEVLWCASRECYGEYAEHLEEWCRGHNAGRDSFGPTEAEGLYTDAPELYERIR